MLSTLVCRYSRIQTACSGSSPHLKHLPSDARVTIGGTQPRTMESVPHKSEKGNSMNFDLGQLTQLLDHVPYPIGKAQLVQFAQQHGANEQIMGMLDHLPDKTFNSS